MQSHLLYKTRCPVCAENGKDRSGDNLGVYSDGHSYCYSCGHSTSGNTTDRIRKRHDRVLNPIPDLPEDIQETLAEEPRKWLEQYFPDGKLPRCLWSPSEKKLFFPIDNWVYQYRYFGDNPKHPKWVSYGLNENYFHIMGSMDVTSIVLVEDLISGIKVGHITPTLTLFGSNISLKRLAALKLMGYNEVIIWLDWDKKEYAIKAGNLARSIGLEAHIILTKLDPKEYSYSQIKDILGYETIKLALENSR